MLKLRSTITMHRKQSYTDWNQIVYDIVLLWT